MAASIQEGLRVTGSKVKVGTKRVKSERHLRVCRMALR